MVCRLANRALALGGGNRLMVYIYGLADPFTHQIRYVGQSNNPLRRYEEHLDDDDDTPKCDWIRELKRKRAKPTLVYLFACDAWQADSTERAYIQQFSKTPWGLTNSTFNGPRKPKSKRSMIRDFFTIDRHEAVWLLKWSAAIIAVIAIILFVVGP